MFPRLSAVMPEGVAIAAFKAGKVKGGGAPPGDG